MNKFANFFDDKVSYVVTKNNTVSDVSHEFLRMTEFDKGCFIDKDLSSVFSLLRVNIEEPNIWNIKVDSTYYLFSKSLNVFEVNVSIKQGVLLEEKIICFSKTKSFQLDEKFLQIYQLCKDNSICVSLYSVPDFILLKASQKYIDFFNEPFNVMENSIGKSLYEILPSYRGSDIETASMEVIHSGKSAEYKELASYNYNRDITYWDCFLVPIFQDDQVKFFSSMAFEVTDRVLEKHKREELEVALTKSRANLIEAQSLANLGSWEWDLVTKEVIWSDEMYQIFGIDKNSILGRLGDAISKVVHPEDLGVFDVGNNHTVVEKRPFEYRIILSDGSIRYIRAKTGDIKFDDSGNPAYLIGVVQDVTEQKTAQLEQSIAEEEKRKSLQREIESKDEFLALISHEFKTPITVIFSAIQVMELICKNDLSDKALGFLNIIKHNSNRQLKLINNLLEVASMNSGHFNVNKRNIDIVPLTKMIMESITTFAEQKGIRISFSSTMQNKMIGIDEEKYERILLNLLSNALKYTQRGKAVSVRLSYKNIERKRRICLEVADEGIGIPSDKIDIIFSKFERVNNSLCRQSEGTGIGLYIVKKLVELLEGKISVESREGAGSIFTILLPTKIIKGVHTQQTLNEIKENRIIRATSIEFSDIYLY